MRNKAKAPATAPAAIIATDAPAPVIDAAAIDTLPLVTDAPAIDVQADAPATDAPADAIDNASRRHAARLAARALFIAADSAVSVPVKAVIAFKAYRAELGALRCNNPTTRQAAALAVACLASGNALPAAATDAPVSFGRVFSHPVTDTLCAIENGCAADCVSTGLASYDAASATFTVSGKQAIAIRGLIGKRLADIATPAPVAA